MKSSNQYKQLENLRRRIAARVRNARTSRQWKQSELAEKIGLSQSRLSEIERGAGSFTAEQLLVILQLFNLPVSHFADARDPYAELQNALARLGATHLQENVDVLPSERLEEVDRVLREAIVVGAPRLVTAAAPVLVRHIDRVSLHRLDAELTALGLERRFAWVVENVIEALQLESQRSLPRPWALLYRRAELRLVEYLSQSRHAGAEHPSAVWDLLDTEIRSNRTLAQIKERAAPSARRHGIATELRPEDFATALERARAGAG